MAILRNRPLADQATAKAMTLHLAEISRAVNPGAHAVVLLDQAGCHGSKGLEVPDNITLLPLPPRSPELNPVENVWQFIRDNWLSNRVFKSCEDILDHCCYAWNSLIEQPWKITSIGTRQWVYE
jgi:transposase